MVNYSSKCGDMKNKGFIFLIEMITTVIILFIIFNFFFPPISFKHKWDETLLNLVSRDVILSLERNEELYKYSFDSQSLEDFLYNKRLIPSSLIVWTRTENAVKKKITIACNCPDDVINNLKNLLISLEINDRKIDFEIVKSDLGLIKDSDVLLIWGYKDLTSFTQSLKNYLAEGKGIVEVSDITVSQINSDNTHAELFGLKSGSGQVIVNNIEFSRKPENSNDIVYYPWKYFYNLPLPSEATLIGSGSPPGFSVSCNHLSKGNFSLQIDSSSMEPYYYYFWVCDSSKVYFDTDRDGMADKELSEGSNLNLDPWGFTLKKIEQDKIYMKFNQEYKFSDFLAVSWNPKTYNNIITEDGNKVLLKTQTIPAVVLNNKYGKTAWIANFTEMKIGDDERLLLISLLLWASNKEEKTQPKFSLGYESSYVNVYNKDFFEVYSFDLGLGYS